jgi:hypothetical protein
MRAIGALTMFATNDVFAWGQRKAALADAFRERRGNPGLE